MEPVLLLFLLRLFSALLLVAFFSVIGWLLYRDLQKTAVSLAQQLEPQGHLRVVASQDGTPAIGTLYPLLPITSIGRAANSTIMLSDSYTSSQHALIARRNEVWWLEDLGSRNGTLLNELPLTDPMVVSASDIVTVGGVQFRLEF